MAAYPVSLNGVCPGCGQFSPRYIILLEEEEEETRRKYLEHQQKVKEALEKQKQSQHSADDDSDHREQDSDADAEENPAETTTYVTDTKSTAQDDETEAATGRDAETDSDAEKHPPPQQQSEEGEKKDRPAKPENGLGPDEGTPLLRGLVGYGWAEVLRIPKALVKTTPVPSFRCLACGAGYNLNWGLCSLEYIYGVSKEGVYIGRDAVIAAAHQAAYVPPVLPKEASAQLDQLDSVLENVEKSYGATPSSRASLHSAAAQLLSTKVIDDRPVGPYVDYEVEAHYNQWTRKFAATSQEEHFTSKGISADPALRQLSRYCDPATAGLDQAAPKKPRKMTIEEARELNAAKKQKRAQKRKEEYLKDDD